MTQAAPDVVSSEARKGERERVSSTDKKRCRVFLLVASHFIACFCGLGTVYTFGQWVPALLAEFGGSDAQTQVISGVLLCGWAVGGILGKALLARWKNYRAVYCLGAGLTVTVLLVVSFVDRLWLTYLVFIAGVGLQITWMVSATLLTRHLSQQDVARFAAFAVTGSGFGTMALSSFARFTIPMLGWRWGLRIMAGIYFCAFAFGAVGQLRPPRLARCPTAMPGGGSYSALFAVHGFPRFSAAVCLSAAGYMNVFNVQGAHAVMNGISGANVASAYTIFGLLSLIGRICTGLIAGRAKPIFVWTGGMYLIAGCIVLIAFATDFPTLAIGNALLGVSSGPIVAMLLPVLRDLAGVDKIPEALVVVMLVQSVGSLTIPVVAGALADLTNSYMPGILGGAGLVLAGGLVISTYAYSVRQSQVSVPAHPTVIGKVDVTSSSHDPVQDVEYANRACDAEEQNEASI